MDKYTTNSIAHDEDREPSMYIEAHVGDKTIKIDKRDDQLIINNECKRIMRNLCAQPAGRGNFDSDEVVVTQPSFLSPEDRILFFKTKMFYLLQERHCFRQQSRAQYSKQKGAKKFTIAEAYPAFLSPFGESSVDLELPASSVITRRRHDRRASELLRPESIAKAISMVKTPSSKAVAHSVLQNQRTGMARFLESIRKADNSVMRILEEKVLKTVEGAGYATLLKDEIRRVDVLLAIFSDYHLLMHDGNDEESTLNSLANHVRTRIKYFDKLQMFYDTPSHRDDHTAHVFTIPNMEISEIHEGLQKLKPKRMHQLDEKKMLNLFAVFKNDYSTAKTTLIADGTQPVVLSRKKLDRVKRYVDECCDWKGSTLVPYVPEMNFFSLAIPWTRAKESLRMLEGDQDGPFIA